MSKQIKRHGTGGIFIHWFNAVAWFFLLATGLALIKNPALQPLGSSYPETVRSIFGGGAALLHVHITVGVIWLFAWVFYALAGIVDYTIPFLKEIFTVKYPRDFHWLIKKQFQMTLGYKAMAKLVSPLGWDSRIPDQDYYNVGQKAAAVPVVLGGIVLAATGLIMAFSKSSIEASQVAVVQWSILIHYLAAGITFAVLLIHIYMSAISKEERPALFSMFTGTVPEEYALHHHKVWYDRVKAEENE